MKRILMPTKAAFICLETIIINNLNNCYNNLQLLQSSAITWSLRNPSNILNWFGAQDTFLIIISSDW